MQTMCESGYIGPSNHSLASSNEPPNKQVRLSKNVSNEVISSGKIHYLGPNKMILTYYDTENADPALEEHFKRSLSASGQELKAAFVERQRTKRVPPSFWSKNMRPPPPQRFAPVTTFPMTTSSYHSTPLNSTYPYQVSRYGQMRQTNNDPSGFTHTIKIT